MPEAQVTATEYDPDDDLRELLDEVLQDATVSYGDEQDLDLSTGIEGFQRDYEVESTSSNSAASRPTLRSACSSL